MATSTTNGNHEGEVARWFDQSVCAFWLGGCCYGLSASIVGEVVIVESCAPVPVAPPEVIGLFNLRGVPVALIDLSRVLDLPDRDAAEVDSASMTALVLRTNTLLLGVRIRKMEMVVPGGRGLYAPPEGSAGEHPMVAGFLTLPERPELT